MMRCGVVVVVDDVATVVVEDDDDNDDTATVSSKGVRFWSCSCAAPSVGQSLDQVGWWSH